MFKVINFSTLLFLMAIIFSHNVLANDEVNNTINTDEDLFNQLEGQGGQIYHLE